MNAAWSDRKSDPAEPNPEHIPHWWEGLNNDGTNQPEGLKSSGPDLFLCTISKEAGWMMLFMVNS